MAVEPQGFAAIRRDLNKLEKRTDKLLMPRQDAFDLLEHKSWFCLNIRKNFFCMDDRALVQAAQILSLLCLLSFLGWGKRRSFCFQLQCKLFGSQASTFIFSQIRLLNICVSKKCIIDFSLLNCAYSQREIIKFSCDPQEN